VQPTGPPPDDTGLVAPPPSAPAGGANRPRVGVISRPVTIIVAEQSNKSENPLSQWHLIEAKRRARFVFQNAWNEWAAGAYVETDSRYHFEYLEAIKGAIDRAPSN